MCGCQRGPTPPPVGSDATDATLSGSIGNDQQANGDCGGATNNAELQHGNKERSVIDKYDMLRKAVARMGLERAWDMAPLLRVSEVAMRPVYG